MNKQFGKLIFTDHALDRVRLRHITQDTVAQTLAHPDATYPADDQNSVKFIRTLNNREIHAVATYLSDQKKWLIISVWVRGEEDPVPFVWKILTVPFKFVAKLAGIILSYIRKNR